MRGPRSDASCSAAGDCPEHGLDRGLPVRAGRGVGTGARSGGDGVVEALAQRRLAGAGLDVFADEPHVPEALLDLENVVLLPHVGSGTVETRAAMEALTLRNLDAFLDSGTLVTPVPMPAAAGR